MSTTKKDILVRQIPMDDRSQELADNVGRLFNNSIKQKMRNEVPSDMEVEEEMEESSYEFNFNFQKIAKIAGIVAVVVLVFIIGLSFRTPVPKLDQQLIQATDTLRSLEANRVSFASGVALKTNQVTTLNREVGILNGKISSTENKMEEIRDVINNIVNKKILSTNVK